MVIFPVETLSVAYRILMQSGYRRYELDYFSDDVTSAVRLSWKHFRSKENSR